MPDKYIKLTFLHALDLYFMSAKGILQKEGIQNVQKQVDFIHEQPLWQTIWISQQSL